MKINFDDNDRLFLDREGSTTYLNNVVVYGYPCKDKFEYQILDLAGNITRLDLKNSIMDSGLVYLHISTDIILNKEAPMLSKKIQTYIIEKKLGGGYIKLELHYDYSPYRCFLC